MAMDKASADAFVYAKASGMLANSFIGSRASQLFSVHSLQELWSLLFKKEVPVVPETLLAKALETEAQNQFIHDYKKLLDNYANPAPVLVSLLHFFDYDNIKEIGAALCFGEKKLPPVIDISPYNIVNYKKWPDIAAMTQGSPFAWYDHVPLLADQQKNDYRLDCTYIEEIWNASMETSRSCRGALMDMLQAKIRMDNILWALRLRIYYGMEKDEIVQHLAYGSEGRNVKSTLVADAVKTLDWELDNYEQWRKWKYASLLNPHEEGTVWNIDSRWIANAYKKSFVEKAYRLFHKYPFTECPLVCWYVLKQNELDTIRTASESLRLHVPSSQAMQTAGITEVYNG